MSLIINHNLMAMNATRNLGNAYKNLSTSVQRLSSGLRINSAADDAAGLAIREMMRADIATTMQGLRNAADAISLIQTADGALGVIDEKLIRMKELAEQAATGTYTTAQREIINSEYQAMAREIDRIANATNFNGVKLLDGSISNQHGGLGLKVHFGVGNDAAEDYYFINLGDARATSQTGLRIAGDAKNDIWGQGAAAAGALTGPGCCTAGFTSLNGDAGFISGQSFSYGYNWDWMAQNSSLYDNGHPDLLTGKYLAGRYTVSSGESLQNLIDKVNQGVQSRVGIKIDNQSGGAAALLASGGALAVCVGDEAYVWGGSARAMGGSAWVSHYNYSCALNGLFGNDNLSFLTNNAGLAEALGFDPATIETLIRYSADSAGARAELNQIIDRMNQGSMFLEAVTGATLPLMAQGFNPAPTGDEERWHAALDFLVSQNLLETETNAFDEAALTNAANLFNTYYSQLLLGGGTTTLDFTTWTDVQALSTGGVTIEYDAEVPIGDPDTRFSLNVWYLDDGSGTWTTNQALVNLSSAREDWVQVSFTARGLNGIDGTFDYTDDTGGNGDLAAFQDAVMFYLTDSGELGLVAGGFVDNYEVDTDIATGFWGHYSGGTGTTCPEGLWTNSPGVRADLNLSALTLAAGTLLLGSTGAATGHGFYLGAEEIDGIALSFSDLTTQVMSTSDVPNGRVPTGIYTDASGAYWTTDATLARELEFRALDVVWDWPDGLDALVDALEAAFDPLEAAVFNRGVMKNYVGGPGAIGEITATTRINLEVTSEREDVNGYVDPGKKVIEVGGAFEFNAYSLASAINHNQDSQFWAMLDQNDSTVLYVFNKEGGDYNNLLACDVYDVDPVSQNMRYQYVAFENVENTGGLKPGEHLWVSAGTNFTLGSTAADVWGKLKPIQTKESLGNEVWNVTLNGKDVGNDRDLWIAAARELRLPGLFDGYDSIINGMDRHSFVEIQDAADGLWAGADLRTQSHAQEALEALNYSIDVKDKIRADLGALQNRLENTMTNLEIQAENLQASESRISDVDVAREMTEFTKNNILTQAATGMLAQANSLSQLALSLIGR